MFTNEFFGLGKLLQCREDVDSLVNLASFHVVHRSFFKLALVGQNL